MDSAFSLNRVEMEGRIVGWIPPCWVLEFRRKRDSFFRINGFWWKVQTLNIFPSRRINGFCCIIVVFPKRVFRRFFLDFFRKIMFSGNFFSFFGNFPSFSEKWSEFQDFSRKIQFFGKQASAEITFQWKELFYEATKNKRPMHKKEIQQMWGYCPHLR